MAEEKSKSTISNIAKGNARDLIINLFLNEIPFIGPLIASKTVRAYKKLKTKGDLTSATGILTIGAIAPMCDLISFFIPLVGPIISTAIYWPIDKIIGSGGGVKTKESGGEKEVNMVNEGNKNPAK